MDGDPIYVIDEYLKQVALDHKEEKQKAIAQGKHRFKGAVFVDAPRDFVTVKKKIKSCLVKVGNYLIMMMQY